MKRLTTVLLFSIGLWVSSIFIPFPCLLAPCTTGHPACTPILGDCVKPPPTRDEQSGNAQASPFGFVQQNIAEIIRRPQQNVTNNVTP